MYPSDDRLYGDAEGGQLAPLSTELFPSSSTQLPRGAMLG